MIPDTECKLSLTVKIRHYLLECYRVKLSYSLYLLCVGLNTTLIFVIERVSY